MKDDKNSGWLDDWLVIINPNSGNRRGRRDWPVVKEALKKRGFGFQHELTRSRGDASRIAAEHISKHNVKKIIVVGGDGTLNETVNGIMDAAGDTGDMALAMIPVGTGNDWGRMYGVRGNYAGLVEIIATGKMFTQDLGMVSYSADGRRIDRYFINVAGTGYDAYVADRTNRLKEQGSAAPFAYLFQLVKGLFKYRPTNIQMASGGNVLYEGGIFSVTIGICRFNGSGMMQLPDALPDDGLLDVVVIRQASKPYILRNIIKVYNGGHVKLPIVDSYRVPSLRLQRWGEQRLMLEADGESLGHGPFEFGVISSAIRMVVAKTPAEQGIGQGSTQSP